MSATATITIPALVLHLRGDDGSLGSLIDEFLDIIEEYRDLTDPLSIDLGRFGEELVDLLANEASLNAEQVALKLHELRKIAVNPLDGSPLEHPRIAGGRIWEEWMLMQVKELFENVSCYSDEASLEDAEVHLFAERILRWQDKIFTSLHPKIRMICEELERLRAMEDRTGYLDREESLRSKPHVAIAGYVELATNADRFELFTAMADKVGRAAIYFSGVVRATEERARAHVEATRVALAESDRRLQEDLEGIRATYMRTIRSLRASLEEARRENVVLEGRISHAEGRISELTSRVLSLEARVHAAEAQNQANQQAAQSGGGSECSIM